MGHIAIVGGGVVGLSVALDLLEAGEAVTVMDGDTEALAASWGNAGHIAVEQIEPLASMKAVRDLPQRLFAFGGPLAFPLSGASAWLPFGLRLLAASRPSRFRKGCEALRPLMEQAMPAWANLVRRIDAADLLRQDGHYVLWHDPKAGVAGQAAWEDADTGAAQVHHATPPELSRLSAVCDKPPAAAIRFSGSGQITDLAALREKLRRTFETQGGRILEGHATLRLVHGKAKISGLEADRIVVCAGVRSRGLMEALGHKVPMIAERGYHIRGDAAGWPEDMPPVVFEERAMIVTRYRDCVQAASFVEFGKVDTPPDPRKWERLERYVTELGLPVRAPFRRWMGHRPTLPDYLPAIGRSTIGTNLYYAFGHQHLGLTLAPITARLVTSMILDEQPGLPLHPFDLQRFA